MRPAIHPPIRWHAVDVRVQHVRLTSHSQTPLDGKTCDVTGVGKTTVIREMARVLADDYHKRVVIVDTSNEIGGDGDVPHPAIGGARRMQVPDPSQQHKVMVSAFWELERVYLLLLAVKASLLAFLVDIPPRPFKSRTGICINDMIESLHLGKRCTLCV